MSLLSFFLSLFFTILKLILCFFKIRFSGFPFLPLTDTTTTIYCTLHNSPSSTHTWLSGGVPLAVPRIRRTTTPCEEENCPLLGHTTVRHQSPWVQTCSKHTSKLHSPLPPRYRLTPSAPEDDRENPCSAGGMCGRQRAPGVVYLASLRAEMQAAIPCVPKCSVRITF